jgi:predicted RNA-binding protein Jag
MTIKLTCKHCDYTIERKQEDLEYSKYCSKCGQQLKVENLDDIVSQDIQTQVRQHLHEWFNTMGIEGTIEMIERNKEQGSAKFYIELLKEKRLIK